MTSLTGIENWPCLLRHVLGGADRMALPVYGDADWVGPAAGRGQ